MKKLPLFLSLSLLAGPLPGTAERPLKATLTEAHGEVQVSAAPDAPWEAGEPGMTLASAARLKTGADGGADVLFEDGTALHLDKNASMTLESARDTGASKEFSIRLWAGKLVSQVLKRDRPVNYRVRTPVAVAAVRGTEFVADASEGATDVAVFEGTVETGSLKDDAPLGDPVAVGPEQEVSVAQGRPAGPPRAISRAMSEYRAAHAALFLRRIDAFRRDTARVQKLQDAFMERRRRNIEEKMERRREGDADKMRDFRRKMRRRAQPR